MSGHYIALLGSASPAHRSALRRHAGYSVVIDKPGMLLACSHDLDRLAFGHGRGLIVGTAFAFGGQVPLDELDTLAADAAVASDGASLTLHLWGSYVAFVERRDGSIAVIRDPSGATACYFVPAAGGLVVTSDVRACVTLGLVPLAIDWSAVAAHLLWPERRTCRTGLSACHELMPGERLLASDKAPVVDLVWQPWRFTANGMQINDMRDAAAEVRRAVTSTVSAWERRYSRPLVSLSGGLDSSIVMAATKNAAGAVTFMTDEPLGDERPYARTVAERCCVELLEYGLDQARIEPGRSNAAGLPRPVSRLFAQELDRIWYEAEVATNADALFHGGGGDNVFCFQASANPYLDSLLASGPGRQSAAVLDSLSRMTRVSAWQIRRAALRKALVDRGRYRWFRDPGMLSPRAIGAGQHVPDHPWFREMPARTLPGKQAHVAAIVRIQNYLEAAEPRRVVPVVAPLMSQPVIEACLRIPTWLWCREGMNRAVARDAFRDLLPAAVIDRRGKGSPAAFDARVVATRRAEIRKLLLNGHLAQQGMIDLGAVATVLAGNGPLRGNLYLRVTELVDVEAWLQSWLGAPFAGDRPQS